MTCDVTSVDTVLVLMQTNSNNGKQAFLPKSITFQQAASYSGLSTGTLRNYDKAGLITVYNVLIPGATRGRKLIDRESLDQLLESSLGKQTTASICGKGGAK